MTDAAVATDRLRAALSGAQAVLADLLRERLAYASTVRVAFADGPVSHADLFERLYGARVEGDRLRRRGPVASAAEVYAAIGNPTEIQTAVKALTATGRSSVTTALAAALSADEAGRPLPSLAALPELVRAGLLPDPAPPVAWILPSEAPPVGARAIAALRAQAEAFEASLTIVAAAIRFTERADDVLRSSGLRSTNAAFPLVRGLAGLPVVTSGQAALRLGVSSSAFATAMPRLVELGLARELTGRQNARAWAAADADLTPDFRLPAERVRPPAADRLADRDPLDLAAHDDAVSAEAARLDALLGD